MKDFALRKDALSECAEGVRVCVLLAEFFIFSVKLRTALIFLCFVSLYQDKEMKARAGEAHERKKHAASEQVGTIYFTFKVQ